MLKEAICTAPSIEEARKAAVAQLNAPEDADVKIEVLEQPVKKTFGLFGGSPAKVRVFYEESDFAKAINYIKTILNGMGIENAEIETTVDGDDVKIEINCGDDYGAVIGRRGETLDAIQYLTRLIINKGTEDYKRISIDVGNYREKREQTLRELAKRTAGKVKKYGRSLSLDPMNPYERRIIHTTIQEIDGVESHSVGNENTRRVIVALVGGAKPAGGYKDSPHSGGYRTNRDNNSPHSNFANNNSTNNANNKPDFKPKNPPTESKSSHTHRSDAASASLYSKVEIKKED